MTCCRREGSAETVLVLGSRSASRYLFRCGSRHEDFRAAAATEAMLRGCISSRSLPEVMRETSSSRHRRIRTRELSTPLPRRFRCERPVPGLWWKSELSRQCSHTGVGQLPVAKIDACDRDRGSSRSAQFSMCHFEKRSWFHIRTDARPAVALEVSLIRERADRWALVQCQAWKSRSNPRRLRTCRYRQRSGCQMEFRGVGGARAAVPGRDPLVPWRLLVSPNDLIHRTAGRATAFF